MLYKDPVTRVRYGGDFTGRSMGGRASVVSSSGDGYMVVFTL